MIDEIRISTQDGRDLFVGRINLETGSISTVEDSTNILFAGFISAILSVSEQVQQNDLKGIIYRNQKLMIETSGNVIFMIFGNEKVPDADLARFLKILMARWKVEFKNHDFVGISPHDVDRMKAVIEKSLILSFWWMKPGFNIRNVKKYLKNTYSNLSSTYYIQYLPNSFLVFSIFTILITILVSFFVGSTFTGFGAELATQQPTPIKEFYLSSVAFLMYWTIPPLIIKMVERGKFGYEDYLKISGLLNIYHIILFVFNSRLYYIYIYAPFVTMTNTVEIRLLLDFLLNGIPINVSFFGFILINGYSTSFSNEINFRRYYLLYIISILLTLSILETFFPYISSLLFG